MTKRQKKLIEDTLVSPNDAFVGLTRDELDETIATQQSLKDYPHENKSNDPQVKKALSIIDALEPHQKQALADELRKSLRSYTSGDGVSSGTAEKSRQSLRDAQAGEGEKMHKLSNKQRKSYDGVVEMFDGNDDLTDEFKEAAIDAFEDAVSRKVVGEAITEILGTMPGWQLMFAEDKTIDIVEQLSERIAFLEQQCETIEEESQFLREQQMRRSNATIRALKEDILVTANPLNSKRSTRNVGEDWDHPDEGNSVLLGENQGTQHVEPAMKKYLNKLNETTRNVHSVSPAGSLHETWSAFEK